MADPAGLQLLIDAAEKGAAVVVTAAAAAIAARIWKPPRAAPPLSDGERLTRLEGRVDELETRLNAMTAYRDAWRYLCMSARLSAEKLAAELGRALPPWPEDPEEPLSPPTPPPRPGGTP